MPEAQGDMAPRTWSPRVAKLAALLSAPFLFLILNLDTGHRPWREWVWVCIPHLMVGLAIDPGRRLVLVIAGLLAVLSGVPAVAMVGLGMMFLLFQTR